MKQEHVSLAFAIAIGCVLGGYVTHYLLLYFDYGPWSMVGLFSLVVGIMLGSATSYCVIDFGEFRTGVKRAWTQTISWRPDTLWWGALGSLSLGISMSIATIFWIMFAISSFYQTTWAALGLAYILIACAFFPIAIFATAIGHFPIGNTPEERRENILLGLEAAAIVNPVCLPLLLFGSIIWSVSYLVTNARHIASEIVGCFGFPLYLIKEITKQTFLYVHSTRRMIASIDTAIGIIIGFVYGQPLLGAVIGIIWGLINYEIVSVRWLKLQVR